MNNTEQQPNKQSNPSSKEAETSYYRASLESLETNFFLTKKELNDFKKLPKDEQEKLKKTKLTELQEMSEKLDVAFQEAVRTGKLEEAQKLRVQLEKEIDDLKQQIDVTRIELPEGVGMFKVFPDPEIISAETAIKKLEKEGHKIGYDVKDLLTKVNWEEKLENSYEIVSITVGQLFGDTNVHNYAEIKVKAIENGLDLIPASLASSIRLNYPKDGEGTVMAMEEPIYDHNGSPRVFHCGWNNSGSWLSYNFGHDDYKWNAWGKFFFVRK